MIKQNPCYKVVIYSNTDTITITNPITCQFSVSRDVLSDNNKATIELYNLAPATRDRIFQDAFTIDWNKFKYVYLYAGYNGNMPLIFKGRILQAYSRKSSGSTDVITEIQAMALDIFDCQTSYTFKAGTTKKEALQTMALDMPNVKLTNLGTLEGEFQTDTTFDGNAMECISKLTNGNAFVDNDTLNCVETYEVIDVPVPVISDDSVLLETPMRRDANLEVKTLFMPDIIVGQLAEIKSHISPNFNGQFKVLGFTHNCLISETKAGQRTTTLNLWIGVFLPNATINDSNNKPQIRFQKVKGIEKITPVIGKVPSIAKSVYNYIQKHNGQVPNWICYGTITWRNMLKNKNTANDILNFCKLEYITNAYYTAKNVYDMCQRYFKGKSIHINSGWRSVQNNTNCGGKPRSRHLYGLACDFYIVGMPIAKTYPIVVSAWNGYTLNEDSWIHVQIEPRQGRANDK